MTLNAHTVKLANSTSVTILNVNRALGTLDQEDARDKLERIGSHKVHSTYDASAFALVARLQLGTHYRERAAVPASV